MSLRNFVSAYKTLSFSSAPAVANAIVTTLATAASPQVLTGASLDGAMGNAPFAIPRTVSVTTAVHSASYTPQAITIKGTDANGNAVTDTLTTTLANGGETIKGTVAFLNVTEIDIGADADALGSYTFGVYDVVMRPLTPASVIRAVTSGNLLVTYADSSTDTLPCTSGEQHFVQVMKVSGATSIGFTLYF